MKPRRVYRDGHTVVDIKEETMTAREVFQEIISSAWKTGEPGCVFLDRVNETNPLPFSRGNSAERVEKMQRETPRGPGPAPDPAAGRQAQNPRQADTPSDTSAAVKLPESSSALQLPTMKPPASQNGANGRTAIAGGALGDALRNLERYVQRDQFENSQGGGQFGPEIQFDTKGVEFGQWSAQVLGRSIQS